MLQLILMEYLSSVKNTKNMYLETISIIYWGVESRHVSICHYFIRLYENYTFILVTLQRPLTRLNVFGIGWGFHFTFLKPHLKALELHSG